MTPHLIFVGGFLGAGKTTLILKAAEILRQRGLRAAVIMNDQDHGLVDTYQSTARNLPTGEVAGGCFCCHFSDLIDAAAKLAQYQPDVIFAEPVGSCVDLAATIMQPLLAFHRADCQLAPLTVLLDPALLRRLQTGGMDANVEFLFRQQIAEADLLCLTKQDLSGAMPELPWPVDFQLSALTGRGVEAWLDQALHTTRTIGARILDIDYERYAEAESALGWLNLHCDLVFTNPLPPSLVTGPLLDLLCRQLTAGQIEIAHLKIFDRCTTGWIKAAVTAADGEPQVEGDLLAEAAHKHQLAINLRALADPSALEGIARRALGSFGAELRIGHLGAFRPAPPVPEYRMTRSLI